MIRPAFALLALLWFAAASSAQSITMPDAKDAKTNRMACVEITTTCKDVRWLMVPSADIDVFREFDPDPTIIRLRFVPYKDGVYSLIVAGALGDEIAERTCTITAAGSAPGPNPPPPPPVPPSGQVADFVVGITDNSNRTPAQAGILMDGSLYAWLSANKIGWRVVDKDAPEFSSERYAKDLADAKVSPPAAIRYLKGKVLSVAPADKVPTSDAVKAFIQGNLGALKVKYDRARKSLYYEQGGEKRRLTRLLPSQAKLVCAQPPARWKDKQQILPRDQWKEISRRDLFGTADWILDQDGIGSCVGNGSTGALRRTRFLAGMKDQKLSPGCAYAQINGGSDNGAVIGDSMTALTQTGTILYASLGETPFYLNQMPAGWQAEAKRFRIAEAYVTPTFDEMMSALQLGYIVVYGMEVGNNFENFTSEGVAGIAGGSGNHCMMADGCKKLANGQFAFDNVNSWGATWGPWSNGRCLLVEGHFTGADTSDCYAIKAATLDPQEPNRPIETTSSYQPTLTFLPATRWRR